MVNGLQHPKHIPNLLLDMVHSLKTTGVIQLFEGKPRLSIFMNPECNISITFMRFWELDSYNFALPFT